MVCEMGLKAFDVQHDDLHKDVPIALGVREHLGS